MFPGAAAAPTLLRVGPATKSAIADALLHRRRLRREKYSGNQLAVFRDQVARRKGMQRIAREMNFSETTFILSEGPRSGGYDVRIFTPAEEVPFAGHPTLGTAFVIMQAILKKPSKGVALNLKVGSIPVTATYKGKSSTSCG